MRSASIALLVAAGLQQAASIQLDTNSSASIRNATSIVSHSLMSLYVNNATGTPPTQVGTFQPLLPAWSWWEGGGVWAGMIDYWAYTNDSSNNAAVTQALMAQVGQDNNYMPTAYYTSLGNDDQGFWAFAALAALEYGYPEAPQGSPTWLELAENVFNTMVPRWGLGSCGGGLKWQIFSYNAGYDYKNSVSNGAFFQIAARLAHYTGNSTYADWANTIWDWTTRVGLISHDYQVFDGTDDTQNCTSLNHIEWSYEPAIFMYGTAMMYNYTNGTDKTMWANRTTGLVNAAARTFFSPYKNATNIMYEPACEPIETCNNDQYSFKAYLSRFMGKTSIVAPFTAATIQPLLRASANGAAKACSGGSNGTECGQKWYTGTYDGSSGVGQDLSALEVMQALLVNNAPAIRTSANVTIQPAKVANDTSGAAPTATRASAAPASASPSKNAQPLSTDAVTAAVAAILAGFAAVAANS